ncbi:MAG TPA: hypothetical protein VGT40_06460 [Methylomirabilota bacterium]|jgi:hypothetical protein|nr:hypothetical protein [Methylomirabilota bacterium]
MDDTYHKGYCVSVRSFLDGARWRTEVRVRAVKHAPPSGTPIGPAPAHWSAATEEEADRYGVQMARTWIDQQAL